MVSDIITLKALDTLVTMGDVEVSTKQWSLKWDTAVPGAELTERTDALPQDLVKSRGGEIPV